MALELHNTENPISNAERLKINENWQRIMSGYSYLQQQIKVLAGGAEVDELIQRLNDAIDNANVAVQDAIDANDKALQTALDTVSQTLVDMNKAISNANTATSEANTAKQGALDATAQAQTAINTMQSLIKNMGHRGTWNDATQFYKNNIVFYNGSSFIALQDNIGKPPPTLPAQSNAYWSIFAEQGARGPEGLRGLPGRDGKDGTGVNIIGELTSESELPTTGAPGDAYMIHGDLYVWQDNTSTWKNVGPIRGPEGPQGPAGPQGEQGPPGEDADLTEINQKVEGIQTEVTEHLAEMDTELGKTLKANTLNTVNRKSNLGHVTASEAYNQINFNYNDRSEVVEIHIPYSSSFAGSLELNVTSTYGNSNASGTAKIMYNLCLTAEGAIAYNDMTILSMPPTFANEFYISSIQKADIARVFVISIVKRKYSNQITIDLTVKQAGGVAAGTVSNSITVNAPYKIDTVVSTTDYPIQQPIFKLSLPKPINAVLETGWSVRPNNSLTYYKDPFGVVHIYGRVDRRGGTPLITIMPVGYRPTMNLEHGVQKGPASITFVDLSLDGRLNANYVEDGGNILIEMSYRTT
ncbi:collagen-like triple helix repeat-containing protein [Lysinibacillus sp. NPDC093216]|uniref:collagen-like triple helix repeat-containing protein n=1 Tax=Lysinibacillus sp. NPDC093216 TaxID=3390576 RepID=UPI003D016088